MTPELVIDIAQQAIYVMILLAAPLLLSVLVVGLLIGMLQAATQINEITLSFVPKLLVLVGVLAAAGPWMLGVVVDFTRRMIEEIPLYIG
jgi:flagellar biosynthetic protein FliQ